MMVNLVSLDLRAKIQAQSQLQQYVFKFHFLLIYVIYVLTLFCHMI